jgi:hypothetical protein
MLTSRYDWAEVTPYSDSTKGRMSETMLLLQPAVIYTTEMAAMNLALKVRSPATAPVIR